MPNAVHGPQTTLPWSRFAEMTDRLVARVLRVRPPKTAGTSGRRPFETPLLVSAIRCVLRYVVLPLVLPLVAVATGATLTVVTAAALGVLLTLDVVTMLAIIATLRRLWRLQHPRRWQYLPLALALAALIGFFFTVDTRALLA